MSKKNINVIFNGKEVKGILKVLVFLLSVLIVLVSFGLMLLVAPVVLALSLIAIVSFSIASLSNLMIRKMVNKLSKKRNNKKEKDIAIELKYEGKKYKEDKCENVIEAEVLEDIDVDAVLDYIGVFGNMDNDSYTLLREACLTAKGLKNAINNPVSEEYKEVLENNLSNVLFEIQNMLKSEQINEKIRDLKRS